jgi:hypothetical protein
VLNERSNAEKPPEPKPERVSNVAVDRVRRCRRKRSGSRLVSVAVLRVAIATPGKSRGRAVEADVPAKRTRAADGGGGNSGGADGDGDAGGVDDGDGDGVGDAGASSLRGGRETFDDRRPPVSACRTRCRCSRSLEKESCPLLFFLFSASTSRLGTDVHTSQ